MKRFLVRPALVALFAFSCGGGAITHRYVDTVVGTTDAYGAPRDTSYSATAETEREMIRITVFERSQCDKLRMKVVQRVDQAMRGDKVVSQEPSKQMQMADGTDGVVPCNERWARNVWVALRIGDETYRLGSPSERGEVVANLSGKLKDSLYGEKAPAEATVVVSGIDAGTISLAGYTSHEARVATLTDELRAILGKDDAAITKDDITQSYVLYEQLNGLDTGGDARIAGLRARFNEVVYQRKLHEQTENLRRNLGALKEAKEVLPALAVGAVPPYMLAAVNGGLASPEALAWARGEVALSVRRYPALCNNGSFAWSRLSVGDYAAPTRLAFSYMRFAYSDPFQQEVTGLCGRM